MSSDDPPPPPASISRDVYSAADPARQRFAVKSHLPRFLSTPNLRRSTSKASRIVESEPPIEPLAIDNNLIRLDSSKLDLSDEYTDKYEWAIVYENQRGMTLFSTPYYSRLSLLPSDPSPFTIPNVSPNRSEQLPTTLADYPLPHGNWRWVSKCWMIDMRSDSGEVQHDGFEYNWMFQTHKWRAEVGKLSAGGWVRRRRWVRLMMRPSKQRLQSNNGRDAPEARTVTPGSSLTALIPAGRRRSVGSSFPPSIASPVSDILDDLTEIDDIWLNDDVEENWTKCRILMKRLDRDGRKLELWKSWLRHYHPDHRAFEEMVEKGKARDKQWTEDDTPVGAEVVGEKDILTESIVSIRVPPKEYLVPVLRIHGNTLLQTFIYPDSRAKFLTMLGLAGLLLELNIGLGIGWGASEMDFWSYTNGLAEQFPEVKVAQETHREINT